MKQRLPAFRRLSWKSQPSSRTGGGPTETPAGTCKEEEEGEAAADGLQSDTEVALRPGPNARPIFVSASANVVQAGGCCHCLSEGPFTGVGTAEPEARNCRIAKSWNNAGHLPQWSCTCLALLPQKLHGTWKVEDKLRASAGTEMATSWYWAGCDFCQCVLILPASLTSCRQSTHRVAKTRRAVPRTPGERLQSESRTDHLQLHPAAVQAARSFPLRRCAPAFEPP